MLSYIKKKLTNYGISRLPEIAIPVSGSNKFINKPKLPKSIIISSLLLNILGLALPLCILQVYDRILPNQAHSTLSFLILGLVGVIILDTIIKIIRSKLLFWIMASFIQKISTEAFTRLMYAAPKKIADISLSININRLNMLNSLGEYYGGPSRLLIIDIPSAFIYLAVMFLIGGKIILVPIILLLLFLGITYRQNRKLRDIVLQRSDQNNKKYDFVIEALQGIHSIKSMAMESLMLRRFERLQKKVAQLCFQSIIMSNASQNSAVLYANLSTIFIVSTGAILVIAGEISIGIVAASTLLSGQLIQPLIRGLNLWIEFANVQHNYEEGVKVFDLPCAEKTNSKDSKIEAKLEVTDLTYHNKQLERTIIESVSFSCDKGKITGFKISDAVERSTFIDLLCLYQAPSQGTIKIGTEYATDDENKYLQKSIAYVSSKPSSFKGSIISNLTMFGETSDTHAARRIAALLGLENDIHLLPNGYDTQLGDGINEDLPKSFLQMISIARAISLSPKILILDDISNILDASAFEMLKSALNELKKNMVIIIISQDNNILNIAEQRFEIWGGQLLDEGIAASANQEIDFFDDSKDTGALQKIDEKITIRPEKSNSVHESLELLENQLANSEHNEELQKIPAAQHCLDPLLMAMGWNGIERHLFESLPHFDKIETVEDLRSVLVRLNYMTKPKRTCVTKLTQEELPCIFETKNKTYVLLGFEGEDTLSIFNGETQEFIDIDVNKELKGVAYIMSPIHRESPEKVKTHNWLGDLFKKFKSLMYIILGLGLLSNMFALALPIFVMNVYDKAIGAGSNYVLLSFMVGISIIVCTDILIRTVRGKAQAYLGARLEELISTQAFSHLLHMPIGLTETASIGSQITRLRLLESVREAFTGPLVNAIVDIPFIFIFLIAIFAIGGSIVAIPITLVGLYIVTLMLCIPMIKKYSSDASTSKADVQNLIIEALDNHNAIRGVSAEGLWIKRFQNLSNFHEIKNINVKALNFNLQTISQAAIQIAGIATLGLGALFAMEGVLTAGALIAVMALLWRVLNPLHQAFVNLTQLGNTLQSLDQVNKLMRITLEKTPNKLPSIYRSFNGKIEAKKLVFGYPSTNDFVLRGLSFSVKPGQFVAITGNSGSGKSTILKVLLGLYPIRGGAVLADDIDIRQLDPGEWRHAISYVPKNLDLFYGTVQQNLKLANPTVSEIDLATISEELGLTVGEYGEFLPEGLDTRLTSKRIAEMPNDLKQRILLARTLVKPSKIFFYDNPDQKLNPEGLELLKKILLSQKDNTTIIMVTQNESLIEMADRALYLKTGQIVFDGNPEDMLNRLSSAA